MSGERATTSAAGGKTKRSSGGLEVRSIIGMHLKFFGKPYVENALPRTLKRVKTSGDFIPVERAQTVEGVVTDDSMPYLQS